MATVQQKMELHEAAVNALALEAGVLGRVHIRGRASSWDLLHYSVLCRGFTLSRTVRVAFTFCCHLHHCLFYVPACSSF